MASFMPQKKQESIRLSSLHIGRQPMSCRIRESLLWRTRYPDSMSISGSQMYGYWDVHIAESQNKFSRDRVR